MTQAELAAGFVEFLGPEGGAVVGEHAAHADAELAEVFDGCPQEGSGAIRSLSGLHLGKPESGVVINGHEQVLPARTIDRVTGIAGDPMAHALDTTEFLGIDVHQIAGMGVFVTHHRFAWGEVRPSRQASTAQHPPHGARRDAQAASNSCLGQKSAPQFDDRQGRRWGDRTWAHPRSRRCVAQARFTLHQVASHPLAHRWHAHAVTRGCGGLGQLTVEDVLNHFESTGERESGILVDVHSAESLRGVGWVAPPSLSNSVRMNSNNVLKLHN